MKKQRIIIVTLSLILLIAISISIFIKAIQKDTPIFNPIIFTGLSTNNTDAVTNFMNRPIFTIAGDQVYFINPIDYDTYFIDNQGNKVSLPECKAEYIYGYGNSVYYSNYEDDYKLYRFDVNNLKTQKICDDMASNVIEYQGYIYFINNSDSDTIYRINLKSGVKEKLNNEKSNSFEIHKNNIYYDVLNKESMDFELYKMDLDGQNQLNIGFIMSGFHIYENTLLYTNKNGLNSLNLETNERMLLSEVQASLINVCNDNIYFSGDLNNNSKMDLFMISLDGKNQKKIMSCDYIDCMYVLGDYVLINDNEKEEIIAIKGTTTKLFIKY